MNMYDVTNAEELTYFWVSSAHDLVPFRGNAVISQHAVIAGRMWCSCTNQTLPFDGFARMILLLRQTVYYRRFRSLSHAGQFAIPV